MSKKHDQVSLLLAIGLLLIFLLSVSSLIHAQFKKPDKPMKYWTKEEFEAWKSFEKNRRMALLKPTDHENRFFGLHDGNKIRTLFYNYGSIGAPNTEPSIEWPVFSGNGYGYEFGALIGAEVVDVRGDVVHIFDDGMLDGGEGNPVGGVNVWGWEPLPGYSVAPDAYAAWNQAQKDKGGIAMSNRSETWGELFPKDAEGNLLWPGQYGEGVITADLESYYVMDDRYNYEFEYFPFDNESDRRGLGLQVVVRGYQYAASLAEDIIFFQFEVTNVSNRPLEKVVAGMIGDPHIGGAGDFSDDFAGFIDRNGADSYTNESHDVTDMVYSWDSEGSSNDFGIPWTQLGWLGYKFLESPGNPFDGIDNDEDGFTDENRFSGIDEDGDWDATDDKAVADIPEENWWNGIDEDGDGIIDDLGDIDKKSDDSNENGNPDSGEPDFDELDMDESDQLGLTSFAAPIYATEEAWDDDKMWLRMTPGAFDVAGIQQNQDNVFIYGSGYFQLPAGHTEKYSIALILGQNKSDLLDNAKVAQWIFKLNYQFTKPPDPPNVWAVTGDRKVTIYWDDKSEQSVDPVFGKDFEGYKIYRSNDKINWGDPITNNQGILVGFKPTAQFDLINDIEGTHPVEWERGLHFDTGKNTGLVHSYTDDNLVNGITYYYAVTAYDQGSIEGNVTPLECSKAVDGPNVVSVVPNAPAAGFSSPRIEVVHFGPSTSIVDVTVLDQTLVDTTNYEIIFDASISKQTKITIRGSDDEVVIDEMLVSDINNLWDKMINFGPYKAYIKNEESISVDSAKWTVGKEVFSIETKGFSGGILYPRDIEIRFFNVIKDTSILVSPQPVKFEVWNVYDNEKMKAVFFDTDRNGEVTVGDRIVPVKYVNNSPKGTWDIKFTAPKDTTITDPTPEPGSAIMVYVSKPFESIDRYIVKGTPAEVVVPDEKAERQKLLDQIAVIPNPYVAASSLEVPPLQVFTVGRGERRVDFIHLPPECTIRIYTLSGEHVQTIEHFSPASNPDKTKFDGTEPWNLLSKDGLEIAAGIYLYHVDAANFGQKLGRIAILK